MSTHVSTTKVMLVQMCYCPLSLLAGEQIRLARTALQAASQHLGKQ